MSSINDAGPDDLMSHTDSPPWEEAGRDPSWPGVKHHPVVMPSPAPEPEKPLKAIPSADGWTKFTGFHWRRQHNGQDLDYWPTRKKFMFDGQVMRGDVDDFIRRTSKPGPAPVKAAGFDGVEAMRQAVRVARIITIGFDPATEAGQREGAQAVADRLAQILAEMESLK